MAKRRLTDRFLRSLKPAKSGTRDRFMDLDVRGFGVRVSDAGHVSFVLTARYPGSSNPATRTVGVYPTLTLERARERARAWHEEIAKGIDPKRQEERRRKDSEKRERQTFAAVANLYIERHVKGQRRASEAEATIHRELVSRWGDLSLHDITKRDIIAMVDDIVARGHRAMARNVLGHAKAFFNWCVFRDLLEYSPAQAVLASKLIGEKKPRQRVLNDLEICALWRAASRLEYPVGPLFKILLLTGARRGELAGAAWGEIDAGKKLLVVPPERFKSDVSHLVPLTDDVVSIIATLPHFNAGECVFSTTLGRVPIRGFTKFKKRLDREMLGTLKALARKRGDDPDTVTLEPFVIHDIRRTVRTRLASLRIPDNVAEMVLGHGRRGLARIYDQHTYEPEMREALEMWAARLRDIVEPSPDNVVDLRARV